MKNCPQCGASNATRAQFCNACGARFRVSDAVSAPSKTRRSASDADASEEPRSALTRSAAPRSDSAPESPNAFWSAFVSFLSASRRAFLFLVRRVGPLLASAFRGAPSFFAKLGRWLRYVWRKSRPARRRLVSDAPKYGRAAWSRVRVALAPSATWPSTRIPDFLVWGVVDFFIWRFPFAIVGIFYAILANEAKRLGDVELARGRAARAKGWLLADLTLGLLSIPFRFFF